MRSYNIVSILIVILLSLTAANIVYAASAPTGNIDVEANSADVIELILYILLALLFSFLCSIAEATLLNITPSYIADLGQKKPKYAKTVKKIRETDIGQSLAAILTMNTIAHTVGAIGAGAKATIVLGSAWFGLFSALMTVAILFLSEIIPKTIGVVFWRKLVRPVIIYIRILNFILYPFIVISEYITKLIAKDKKDEVFNRDEFIAMAGMGQKTGQLKEREFSIIQNLFRLANLTTKEIYTPRTVVVALHEEITVDEAVDENRIRNFSRILVHEGNLDKVTGFVLTDEILFLKGEDKGQIKLKELKREIDSIPPSYPISKLLENFLHSHRKIAIVIDEFGSLKGLVTLEDVLETLLGMEIVDENDTVDDMRKLAKQLWKKRMKQMGIDPPEDEELENTNVSTGPSSDKTQE